MLNLYSMQDYKVRQKDNAYISIDRETLINTVISYRDNYRDSLLNGPDVYSIDWESSWVSIESLTDYYLNIENLRYLLQIIINKEGGFDGFSEKFISEITKPELCKDENSLYEYIIKTSRGQSDLADIIESVQKEDKMIIEDDNFDDLIRDIKDEYARQDAYSRQDKDYESIENAFDGVLNECFGKQSWNERREEEKIMYDIDIDSSIFDMIDDLQNASVYNHFIEYYSTDGWSLNPYFSDYGDVDKEEFNNEVKSLIKQYYKNIVD